jgi:hypothetical protein
VSSDREQQASDETLPSNVQAGLESFLKRVERLRIEDLPMFAAAPLDQEAYDESVTAATRAAFDTDRREILEEGHRAASRWLDRLYSQQQFYPEWAGPAMSRSVGTAADLTRLRRSMLDAISALVLWDVLDEAYRDELIGPWAALIDANEGATGF